ncbi:AMP-binding protein [Pacificimonas sp. WHA3]|uniref:AMP-binding protein n=1 Tax=Pacificimonas pallii TaxID=2827236 RepID=A0ABS6SBN4_9SPHN|nr:AMP-binding protein [Pacificimonas pallii]MBV7255326.1 AMP-binding protein [Pacificimonas pallii]
MNSDISPIPRDLLDAIASHAESAPSRAAIISPNGVCDWQALRCRIDQIATALLEQDLAPGDRVVLAGGISADFIAAIFGICAAGGIVTPLPMFITRRDADALLSDCDPALILGDDTGKALLGPQAGMHDLPQFGQHVAGSHFPRRPRLSSERPISLIYSSGTTGRPKGILHSMAARAAYGLIFAREYGIDAASVTLLATAPYSNGTWMTLLPTIYSGGTLVIDPDLKAEAIPDQIAQHGVTHAFLVPTQLGMLFPCDGSLMPERDLTIVSAGSVLPSDLKRRMHENSHVRLFELYGNTEGVCTILRPGQMDGRMESVGTPVETGMVAILDSNLNPVPAGTIGEVAGSNILISDGYFRQPQLNGELFWQSSDGSKYVRSGDLGEIDEQGFLHLRGRIKDMIVSGGANVYPQDIEAEIRNHPDIVDAAVIARPDHKWGEVPYAFFQLKQGSTASADDIIAWSNARLGKYQRLQGGELCAEFPRNALGKIMKPLLTPGGDLA